MKNSGLGSWDPEPSFSTTHCRRKFLCCGGETEDIEGFDSPRSFTEYKAIKKVHKAASAGDVAKVRRMLSCGKANVNDRDKNNRTALHFACAYGHPEVVGLLLRRNCDIDAYDSDSNTALMKASQCQQEKCMHILLKYGADPNRKDANGNTALNHAISVGNMKIAAKLISYGANMDNIKKDDLSAIITAEKECRHQVTEISSKGEVNEHEVNKMERNIKMIPLIHKKCPEQQESKKKEAGPSHANIKEEFISEKEQSNNKLKLKRQLEVDVKTANTELSILGENLSELLSVSKKLKHQSSKKQEMEEENKFSTDKLQSMKSLQSKSDSQLEESIKLEKEDENLQTQYLKCKQLEKENYFLIEQLQFMKSLQGKYDAQTEEITKLNKKIRIVKIQNKKYVKEVAKLSTVSEKLQIESGKCQQLEDENAFLKGQLESLLRKYNSQAQENTKLKEDLKCLNESYMCTLSILEKYKIFLKQKSEREVKEQLEKVSSFLQEQSMTRDYQDSLWESAVKAQQSKIFELSNKLQESERIIKRLEDENYKLHLKNERFQTSSEIFGTRTFLNEYSRKDSHSFLGSSTSFPVREQEVNLSPKVRSAIAKMEAFLKKL